MAINKVVNRRTSSHGAMRNVLEYVLRNEKIKEGYVEIAGPYSGETINYDDVYQTWLAEKRLWAKDSGRMYTHNIINFHRDEQVTPQQVLEIGREFAEQFFSGHQYIVGVHQDKDHLHCHIVANTVSYIDGLKLHQTKHDLEFQKVFTNQLCMERGLSVAIKGQHFDGTPLEKGHVIAWNKDTYNLLLNDSKQSYVTDCAIAVMETIPLSANKAEFISGMEARGWFVQWKDNRKHIVFQNGNGQKIRDTNLEKTFHIPINKEALTHEFERQNELRISQERQQTEQFERYYTEVDAAVSGARTNSPAVRGPKASHSTEGSATFRREIRGPEEDTDALVRDIRTEICDNRLKRRTIRHTDSESILAEQQSIANSEQRRLEEQRRSVDLARTERIGRKMSPTIR